MSVNERTVHSAKELGKRLKRLSEVNDGAYRYLAAEMFFHFEVLRTALGITLVETPEAAPAATPVVRTGIGERG